MPTEIHILAEERNDVGIEGLPIWVLEMVFLGLQNDILASTTAGEGSQTHALGLETLYNSECSWIVNILHNKPVHRLLVLAVHACGFDKLGLDSLDRLGLLVGIKMNGECIDHIGDRCVAKRKDGPNCMNQLGEDFEKV